MEKIYFSPDEEDQKFLTKFLVSDQKLPLYGIPPIMKQNSNLIAAMMDKLSPGDEYLLASNISLKEAPLKIVWLFLNNAGTLPGTGYRTFPNVQDDIEVWTLLNYFDVPHTNPQIFKYLEILINTDPYFNRLLWPENKDILDDISKKIKFIDKELAGKLQEKLGTRKGEVDWYLVTPEGKVVDSFILDSRFSLDENLETLEMKVEGTMVDYDGSLWTYPELMDGRYVSIYLGED